MMQMDNFLVILFEMGIVSIIVLIKRVLVVVLVLGVHNVKLLIH